MSTTRERAEQKRQEKLDLVREQVDNGSLVIRSMTDAERLLYPPRAERDTKPGGRGGAGRSSARPATRP